MNSRVTKDTELREVARLFLETGLDEVIVVDNSGRPEGSITRLDLIRHMAQGSVDTATAGQAMQCKEFDVLPGEGKNQAWNTQKPSLEELEITIECMYNPVVSIDTNGNVRVFNRAAEKVLGLKAHEVRGRNLKEIVHNSKLIEVVETGQVQSTQKITVGDRTFLSNRTPMVKNGTIVGAVAVLQEISELEEISKELEYTKRLNQELDAIIESSFDGLYITDGEGNTLRVNKATERITGVPAEEVIGRNMRDLVKAGVYSRSGTLLALEKRERVTTTLVTRTGRTVLVTSTPIHDESGRIFRVVTNVRDVTELNELKEKLEQISQLYQSELQQLKLQSSRGLVVKSPRMREVIELAMRVAAVDSTVLIQGESGVGKEVIAELIHTNSSRKDGPFVKINCGAIPESLLESELFGYEAGAFTGASREGKAGLFELANGGTLLLDEIGEMPLALQVKLLRVLQDMEITRLGSTKPRKIDVRVIAGTNRDLAEMVRKKQFREDLYYRLNVIPVFVPALRERKEDIVPLVQHFLQVFNSKYGMNKKVSPEAMERLITYDWPGNVRELENLIERMVVITVGEEIKASDLPLMISDVNRAWQPDGDILPLRRAVENLEKTLLEKALARYGSTYRVARALEINQSTVFRKAVKYGLIRVMRGR